MARFSAFVLVAVALALVTPSQQQYYPYPYYPGAVNNNQRLFFGGAFLPNALVRTTTSTLTITSSATCTRSVANACDAASNPFPNGFARSLPVEAEEKIVPSKVGSVEPTAIPAKRQIIYPYPGYYYPNGVDQIDSSIVQAAGYYPNGGYPAYPGAAQARLFFTRTTTTTTVSTTTRSLQPVCSRAGFFTQC